MANELLDKLYLARSLYACYETNRRTEETLDKKVTSLNHEINRRNSNKDSVLSTAKAGFIRPLHTKVLAIVFGAIALFWGILEGVGSCVMNPTTYLGEEEKTLIPDPYFGIVMGAILGLGVIAIIIDIIVHNVSIKKVNNKLAKDRAKVNESNAIALKKYDVVTQKVKEEKSAYQTRLAYFKKNTDVAESAFQKFVSSGFLYRSYQSIVPICQFIQYLESGRCSELEGPNGCYNLFESELRQNIIINKLDNIEQTLYRMEANQHVMMNTLASIDKTSKELCNVAIDMSKDVANIRGNVEAIKVCSAITASATVDVANSLRSLSYYN